MDDERYTPVWVICGEYFKYKYCINKLVICLECYIDREGGHEGIGHKDNMGRDARILEIKPNSVIDNFKRSQKLTIRFVKINNIGHIINMFSSIKLLSLSVHSFVCFVCAPRPPSI